MLGPSSLYQLPMMGTTERPNYRFKLALMIKKVEHSRESNLGFQAEKRVPSWYASLCHPWVVGSCAEVGRGPGRRRFHHHRDASASAVE